MNENDGEARRLHDENRSPFRPSPKRRSASFTLASLKDKTFVSTNTNRSLSNVYCIEYKDFLH